MNIPEITKNSWEFHLTVVSIWRRMKDAVSSPEGVYRLRFFINGIHSKLYSFGFKR